MRPTPPSPSPPTPSLSLYSSPNPNPHFHFSFPFSSLSKRRRLRPRWWTTLMASTSTNNVITTLHNHHFHHHRKKDKILVIMGATGTGKSRLSVDLATRFFPSEIINSDKMQLYRGLDITTNKITMHERKNVPHYLLGDFDPEHGEVSPLEYRRLADLTISDIISRKKLPLLVGGSNSLIYSLLAEDYDTGLDVFGGSDFNSVSRNLRYDCCFLWVDASLPVLYDYLNKRVDDMLDSGMFEELQEYFSEMEEDPERNRAGLKKAIGVPELGRYFGRYNTPAGKIGKLKREGWDRVRRGVYEEAVREIKENTCRLAKRQIGKIMRLKQGGWELRRLDATAAFKALMESESDGGEEWRCIWDRQVLEPSVNIVTRFLQE